MVQVDAMILVLIPFVKISCRESIVGQPNSMSEGMHHMERKDTYTFIRIPSTIYVILLVV